MENKEILKRNGFSFECGQSFSKESTPSNGYFAPRDWQVEAFNDLKDSSLMILNAPMGSGKSWLMCLLSAHKMKHDNFLRCIIAVPQKIIAPGFAKAKIKLPNGEELDWSTNHNLCDENFNAKSNVNYITRWLETTQTLFSDRILLCTHAALVATYKKLIEKDSLHLWSNVLVWIDEAHHIKNNSVETMETELINNELGKLVTYLSSKGSHKLQVGLTTASFFRGDRCTLITDEMEKHFKRYNLPYDRYLSSMKHLKSFSFDFLLCGYDYTNGVEAILKEKKGRDIIYIPHSTSRYSLGNKHKEVKTIIEKYKNAFGGDITEKEDGLIHLESPMEHFKILDLVDDSRFKRPLRQRYVHTTLKTRPTDLDTLIAMNMFKEGADWVCANRCIIAGPRASLVDVIQMIGRLLRDYPEKEHVEVIQLLPIPLDQSANDFSENWNDYLKAIFASLLLEDILSPVAIKIPRKETKENKEPLEKESCYNILKEQVPNETIRHSLVQEATLHLLELTQGNTLEEDPVASLRHRYNESIPAILEKYGIAGENIEQIADHIWQMNVKRSLNMEGINVEDIDFNILQNTHPLGAFIRYTSDILNSKTFEKLREAIRIARNKEWRSFEKAREWVRSLNLNGEAKWRKYIKGKLPKLPSLPSDIPATPSRVYKDSGWISWGDFLGTGNKGPRDYSYRSFSEARNYIRSLNLKGRKDWDLFIKSNKKPVDIPTTPDRVYKNSGWIGWGDFLGSNYIATQNRVYRSFEEARVYARTLDLQNQGEWFAFAKTPNRPQDIPAYPNEVYTGKGWIGWGDFLGTGFVPQSDRKYKSFDEARDYMRSLNLKNYKEWSAWTKSTKRPQDIPAGPYRIYQGKGWKGLGDFLGTGNIAPKDQLFRSFDDARAYAQQLGLKGKDEWTAWAKTEKRPQDIPASPRSSYKNQGWTNWGDFLGTGRLATNARSFRPFLDARNFARSLNLKGTLEWRSWAKTSLRPIDIPSAPSRTYKNEWINWNDWLFPQ